MGAIHQFRFDGFPFTPGLVEMVLVAHERFWRLGGSAGRVPGGIYRLVRLRCGFSASLSGLVLSPYTLESGRIGASVWESESASVLGGFWHPVRSGLGLHSACNVADSSRDRCCAGKLLQLSSPHRVVETRADEAGSDPERRG